MDKDGVVFIRGKVVENDFILVEKKTLVVARSVRNCWFRLQGDGQLVFVPRGREMAIHDVIIEQLDWTPGLISGGGDG